MAVARPAKVSKSSNGGAFPRILAFSGGILPSVLVMETHMPAKQDAIALLKADHRKVEALFEKYETARSKKQELAKQICMELTVHTIIEEEIFYPACREAGLESDMM